MPKRQLAMVIDLNKCLGCQSCTVTCHNTWTNRQGREFMFWNHVESMPSSGYPKNWRSLGGGFDEEQNLVKSVLPAKEDYATIWEYDYKVLQEAKVLKPSVVVENAVNFEEEKGVGSYPLTNYSFSLPRLCNHCDEPSCVSACEQNAVFKREEDGVVLIDKDLCIGEQDCIKACPYKKIYFNESLSKSEKCNFCFPLIERGMPPVCATQCSGRTRFVGFLDDETSAVYKLVKKHKVALALLPEANVGANVYYIPPVFSPVKLDEGELAEQGRIEQELLVSLFGEAVQGVREKLKVELQKQKEGEVSAVLETLVAKEHKKMFSLDTSYYHEELKQKGIKYLEPLSNLYESEKK